MIADSISARRLQDLADFTPQITPSLPTRTTMRNGPSTYSLIGFSKRQKLPIKNAATTRLNRTSNRTNSTTERIRSTSNIIFNQTSSSTTFIGSPTTTFNPKLLQHMQNAICNVIYNTKVYNVMLIHINII